MIYTVTLNPSIDFITRLDAVNIGEVNRMDSDSKFPGGKGINVSRILHFLAIPNVALGFLGGFTGKFIEECLDKEHIRHLFTRIGEDTRINVKIKANVETEINGAGPHISATELNQFLHALDVLQPEDIVILAGSAPKNLGNHVYQKIIEKIRQQHAEFVLDVEGQTLLDSLVQQPLLVKPNNHELGEMFHTSFQSKEEMIPYGQKLLERGAQHVLISLAGDGALMITKAHTYFAPAIKGQVKNSVGAGDSMIAGFVGTFAQTKEVIQAFKMGVACGSATAFSDDLATADFIEEMVKKVQIEEQ